MIVTNIKTQPSIIKVSDETFFNVKNVSESSNKIDCYVYFKLPLRSTLEGKSAKDYLYEKVVITFERDLDKKKRSSRSYDLDDDEVAKMFKPSTVNGVQAEKNSRIAPLKASRSKKRQYVHKIKGIMNDVLRNPPDHLDASDFLDHTKFITDKPFRIGNKEILFRKTIDLSPEISAVSNNIFSITIPKPIPKISPIKIRPDIFSNTDSYQFDKDDILGLLNDALYNNKPEAGKSPIDLPKKKRFEPITLDKMLSVSQHPTVISNEGLASAASQKNLISKLSGRSSDIERDSPFNFDPPDPDLSEQIGSKASFSTYDVDKLALVAFGTSKSDYASNAFSAYFDSIPGRHDEDAIKVFEYQRVEKQLEDFEIKIDTDFSSENIFSSFLATIKLYTKGSNSPASIYKTKINLASHVAAFHEITESPKIEFLSRKNPEGCKVVIDISSPGEKIKCKGVNLYVKGYDDSGTSTSYKLVGFYKLDNIITVKAIDKFNALKVVPVDRRGKESSIYSMGFFGIGHPSINKIVLTPSYRQGTSASDEKVIIQAHNIPPNCKVKFYKRDITKDPFTSTFKLISTVTVSNRKKSTVSVFDQVSWGRYVEYVAVADMSHSGIGNEKRVSNYAILKHPFRKSPNLLSKGLSVDILGSSISLAVINEAKANLSFRIRTTLDSNARKGIKDAIRNQLPDLYSRFLDPANNKSSPLASENALDSLVGHEVVRTNIRTAERVTFPIIFSEMFEDNDRTRNLSDIKPINPQDTYHYEVYSYLKDPVTLLENYIERGKNDLGKEYFYIPYKWKQPRVISDGVLYPDDDNGYPQIDQYDALEPAGLRDTYTLKEAAKITELTSVVAKRIDLKTIKVSWDFESKIAKGNELALYEGFVVMKNCNGKRSILGTSKETTFYDRLDPIAGNVGDYGNIYYTIVPIMQDQTNDTPGQSNVIYVDPKDLDDIVKTPWTNNINPNKLSLASDIADKKSSDNGRFIPVETPTATRRFNRNW